MDYRITVTGISVRRTSTIVTAVQFSSEVRTGNRVSFISSFKLFITLFFTGQMLMRARGGKM